MNILPKKRWHVRTKENIARVRRDEAQAAEEARIEQARIDKAESEARLNFLRNESRRKNGTVIQDDIKPVSTESTSNNSSSKHINFFEELEQGNIDYKKTNKDYEKDKKEEQEKYEKQIGLLTYLGQGIKEAVSQSWYNELPKRIDDPEKNVEIKPNRKALEDPIQDIKRYLNIMNAQKSEKKKNEKILSSRVKREYNTIKLEPNTVKMENDKSKSKDVIQVGLKRKHRSDDSSEDDRKHKKKYKKHKRSSIDDSSSEDDHKSHRKHKKHKSSSDSSSDSDHKSRKKYKKHKKHKKHKKQKKKKEKEITNPTCSTPLPPKPIFSGNNSFGGTPSGPGTFGGIPSGPDGLSKEDIQKLREERLQRERLERLKAKALLAEIQSKESNPVETTPSPIKQKYNSQFFPQLARQNCDRLSR